MFMPPDMRGRALLSRRHRRWGARWSPRIATATGSRLQTGRTASSVSLRPGRLQRVLWNYYKIKRKERLLGGRQQRKIWRSRRGLECCWSLCKRWLCEEKRIADYYTGLQWRKEYPQSADGSWAVQWLGGYSDHQWRFYGFDELDRETDAVSNDLTAI